MLHSDRVHGIKAVSTRGRSCRITDLAQMGALHGFEFDDFLYLNDGDREDVPEYASLKIEAVEGLMVTLREAGRIKPLGMEASEIREFVHNMRAGRWNISALIKVKAEPDWHHCCENCEFKDN